MTPLIRGLVTAGALSLAVTGSASGPSASVSQQSPVAIAVRAIANDGYPVLDLTPGEVSVAIGGGDRPVLSLQLVARSREDIRDLPVPFVSNASPSARRRMLIYVDEESLNPGDQAEVEAGIDYLLERLDEDDDVGLVSTRAGGMAIAPGPDRERLRRAMTSLSGLRTSTNRCVFADVVTQLLVLFQSLPSETPTTVVLFTGGVDPTYSCDVRRIRQDVSEAGRAAQGGALDFYIVHVFSRSGQTGDPALLQDLAGTSGGTFLRLASGRTDALAGLVTETAAYYIVRFDAGGAVADSSARQVRVETTRRGVRLRSQRWIRLTALTSAAPGVTEVSEVLRSPGEWRALQLRARTLVSPDPGDARVRLLTMFDSPESADLSAAMIGVFEADGTTIAQWSARASELKAPLTLAAMPVPPGRYRVRVAAASLDGRVGAVDQLVEADVGDGDVQVSSLLFAVLDQGALVPVLEFVDEPVATAYLEISGVAVGTDLSVRLELLNGDGTQALEPIDAAVRSGSAEALRIAHGQFPLESLEAGDYLVRATVMSDGTTLAARTATLRKR